MCQAWDQTCHTVGRPQRVRGLSLVLTFSRSVCAIILVVSIARVAEDVKQKFLLDVFFPEGWSGVQGLLLPQRFYLDF
jgi:hypothetical protein